MTTNTECNLFSKGEDAFSDGDELVVSCTRYAAPLTGFGRLMMMGRQFGQTGQKVPGGGMNGAVKQVLIKQGLCVSAAPNEVRCRFALPPILKSRFHEKKEVRTRAVRSIVLCLITSF